jgi:hypothetical protein
MNLGIPSATSANENVAGRAQPCEPLLTLMRPFGKFAEDKHVLPLVPTIVGRGRAGGLRRSIKKALRPALSSQVLKSRFDAERGVSRREISSSGLVDLDHSLRSTFRATSVWTATRRGWCDLPGQCGWKSSRTRYLHADQGLWDLQAPVSAAGAIF